MNIISMALCDFSKHLQGQQDLILMNSQQCLDKTGLMYDLPSTGEETESLSQKGINNNNDKHLSSSN